MAEKLSFIRYLMNKEILKEAVKATPVAFYSYVVAKYCSLAVGESKQSAISVGLRPKQMIIVEWSFEDKDHPTPLAIKFSGVIGINEDTEFETFWSGDKLQKWLNSHTTNKMSVME